MAQALAQELRSIIEDAGQKNRRNRRWSRGRAAFPRPPEPGLAVLVGSLFLNILSLGLPLVILQIYDRILPNQATETLFFLCMGLVVILILDAIFRIARGYITGWRAAQFEHRAACAAVDRLLSAEVNAFEKEAPGVHLDRLAAIGTLRDHYGGQAKLLIVDLPFVSLFLGLIAFIGGWLVAVPMALFAILALATYFAGRALQAALRDRATLDDRRVSFAIETLCGIQTIKLLAMEPQMQRRYERLQESAAASSYDVTHVSNISQSLGWFFSNLVMVAVASYGATLVIGGQLSMGSLAACTLLAGRAVQPVLRGLGLWAQFQNIRIAKERVRGIFSYKQEAPGAHQEVAALKGGIEVENLSFRYSDDGPLVLDGVNLSVKPGQVVGIKGDSGGGKTTLMMLLMGLLTPSTGLIRIDGHDVSACDPGSLRQQIAFLPQRATLFKGTILENLTLFDGGATMTDALATAKTVGLHEKVRHLPAGYQTTIGDGAAAQLPVGMAQSIAIARALAKGPGLILFDEANGGLDSNADARVKATLSDLKGKATIILVSHRPSLLALADQTFQLSGGRLTVVRGQGKPNKSKRAIKPGKAPAKRTAERQAKKASA